MSKKQIRLTQDGIRRKISEAIRSYNEKGFNIIDDEPGDEFGHNGNKRYPEGVFSTDSEEGESFKERAKKYSNLKDDEYTVGSVWDTDKKLDKIARDEFGDEEEESKRYEKPFGDLDDVENQWEDEPGYEEDEYDDDNIAGINEGKVTLSEEGLRKFVSYSVARLLMESCNERDDDEREDYDYGPYYSGYVEIEMDEDSILYALKEVVGVEFNEQYKQKVAAKYDVDPDRVTEWDFIDEMEKKIGFDTFVRVWVNIGHDYDPGDYLTPPYEEDELKEWKIDDNDRRFAQASDTGKKIMQVAVGQELKTNYDENALYNKLNEGKINGSTKRLMSKDYLKNTTWDEHCESRRKEHKEDQMNGRRSEKPNKEIMLHFGGKKHERMPEDDERVNKMKFSKDDLMEMTNKVVKRLLTRRK